MAKFGLVILIGFGLIGLAIFFKGNRELAMDVWLGAALVCVLSVVLPAAAKPLYFIWMGFGLVMGAIMSRVIMTIIYYVVLTPVALFFKLKGRDALERKKKNAASYWHDHPQIDDKDYYQHLF
jgi:hypothetical protein